MTLIAAEIQHPLIKIFKKLGIEEKFLNVIKGIYEKSTANIILNGRKLNTFPLRLGTRQGYLLSTLLFNVLLKILARAVGHIKT